MVAAENAVHVRGSYLLSLSREEQAHEAKIGRALELLTSATTPESRREHFKVFAALVNARSENTIAAMEAAQGLR
jgi:hypothetical protein